MALFHTTVLDNQIKALPTVKTASGSVATFDTDMTENLVEVKCQIVAQQSGSGTPSPSNPRPITVYTSLNLSHSGADTSNPTVYNIPFGQTVANGVLDITTGKLRVTHGYALVKDLNWAKIADSSVFYTSDLANLYIKQETINDITLLISDEYESVTYANRVNNGTMATPWKASTLWYVYVCDNRYTDATDFKNNATGCIVYPLATPIEIQLESITLQALLNENNIWCDTGDTEVKYLLTVGEALRHA